MARPSSGIKKKMLSAYIEIGVLKEFKEAAYAKTGSFKGISRCLEEAMKEWLGKK
jgi:hypothetical protein